jgi:hypothetical protein
VITLAGALATATDQELVEALQSLTKARRYHIKDLAQRLEPEEKKRRQSENGRKGGLIAMSKLTPAERSHKALRAAFRRWGKEANERSVQGSEGPQGHRRSQG